MQRLVFSTSLIFLAFSSVAEDISIVPLSPAELSRIPEATDILFCGNEGELGGWSHIFTHPENFPGVNKAPSRYRVDESCFNQSPIPNFETILVKKYGDWNQQHANGLISPVPDPSIKVSEVSSLDIYFRINLLNTKIPNLDTLAQKYSKHLTPSELENLDDSKANLAFAFVGQGNHSAGEAVLHLESYVSIDTAELSDQWIHLNIPLESMSVYQLQNYVRTDVSLLESGESPIHHLRINPETKSGKVVRNFIQDQWDDSMPEIYKEMSVSIAFIGVTRK